MSILQQSDFRDDDVKQIVKMANPKPLSKKALAKLASKERKTPKRKKPKYTLCDDYEEIIKYVGDEKLPKLILDKAGLCVMMADKDGKKPTVVAMQRAIAETMDDISKDFQSKLGELKRKYEDLRFQAFVQREKIEKELQEGIDAALRELGGELGEDLKQLSEKLQVLQFAAQERKDKIEKEFADSMNQLEL